MVNSLCCLYLYDLWNVLRLLHLDSNGHPGLWQWSGQRMDSADSELFNTPSLSERLSWAATTHLWTAISRCVQFFSFPVWQFSICHGPPVLPCWLPLSVVLSSLMFSLCVPLYIWKHVCEQLKHLCVSGAGSLLDSCTLVLHTWKWWTHLLVITWFSGYKRPSQTFSWCLIVELSLSLLPSACVFALFHSINITYISFSSLQKPGGGSERDCCGERKLWINLFGALGFATWKPFLS